MAQGTAPAASTAGVVVATRCQVPTAFSTVAQNFTGRRSHWSSFQGAITNLRTLDLNWYLNDAGKIPNGSGNSVTLKKYIEYPVDVFHQVKWSGATTIAIGNKLQAVSDVVLSSITGQPLVIPADTKFWERTVKTSAGSQNISVIETPANMDALGLDDGGSTTDKGNSGTIAASASPNSWGSAAILGDIAVSGAKSFIFIGDSIVWGVGDVTNVDSRGGSGWAARAVGPKYPYIKFTKPGQQASIIAALADVTLPPFFAALGVTDAIYELGIVDLGTGRTVAQVLADQQTNLGRLPASVRKWQTTITPSSDSTDSWATVINQTPATTGNEADIPTLNAAIRAVPAGLAGIIEAADFAMSARDSGVWGGPFPPTLDGTHPTTAKHAAMAALYVP